MFYYFLYFECFYCFLLLESGVLNVLLFPVVKSLEWQVF